VKDCADAMKAINGYNTNNIAETVKIVLETMEEKQEVRYKKILIT